MLPGMEEERNNHNGAATLGIISQYVCRHNHTSGNVGLVAIQISGHQSGGADSASSSPGCILDIAHCS
jgi:hypothetical protein